MSFIKKSFIVRLSEKLSSEYLLTPADRCFFISNSLYLIGFAVKDTRLIHAGLILLNVFYDAAAPSYTSARYNVAHCKRTLWHWYVYRHAYLLMRTKFIISIRRLLLQKMLT